ncbi:hypothetical protein KAR91_38635 [Candidatus Pacearchaeota archaeon]|nr:hypothetical protein [Candidatus Pacearchaeota archaeon]
MSIKIAVAGTQGAGKSTIAKMLSEALPGDVEIIKFAGPIYGVLSCLKQDKHRKFMQDFSDLSKKYFGDGIFRDLFLGEAEDLEGFPVICDDLRYVDEAKLVRANGFKLIFVDAVREIRKARVESQGIEFVEDHSSEQEQQRIPYEVGADIFIDGGTSLDILRANVDMTLERFMKEKTHG